MALTNPWVGYKQRSYLQIKQEVLDKIADPSIGIPELTDHNDSNPFVVMVSIWAGLTEQLNYYIDNRTLERFLVTARRYASAWRIAQQHDYRVKLASPSTGSLRFTLSGTHVDPIVIPVGTIVSNEDGIQWITLQNLSIPAGQTFGQTDGIQWVDQAETVIGQTDGTDNQTIEFGSGKKVVDGTAVVTIDSQIYSRQETWAKSASNAYHVKMFQSVNQEAAIQLGDNINGFRPASGLDVNVGWKTTEGSDGNVPANTVTNIVSSLTIPGGLTVEVTNPNAMTGGDEYEDVSDIRRRLPLVVRTKETCVTAQDYIDIATIYPGVAKANVDHTCGGDVNLYIAPNGGGEASETLRNNVKAFVELFKILGKTINVFSAGTVNMQYSIVVNVDSNVKQTDVSARVKANLLDFHSIENQSIKGSIKLGDIYQIVENTIGVANSEILIMTPIPYATPKTVSVPALDWDVEMLEESESYSYIIKFISASTFTLNRGAVFVGTYNVGDTVQVGNMVKFKINVNYSIGDEWTFRTYKSFGTVNLQEQSVITTEDSLITLTMQGGI